MSSVAKKQKSESFYSTIREDLKDIEKNISILKDASTSLIHSEIKDHSLLCETPDEFVSFIYTFYKISLRSNVEELDRDIKRAEVWLSKNNIEDIDESTKQIVCDLDVYEKQMFNYMDFETQLPILNEIKHLIDHFNCKENYVKESIHYGRFKTFFKSNKNLKNKSIEFFNKVEQLKNIDNNDRWHSITSDDFSFNNFLDSLSNFERIYSDILHNIERLTGELDRLRAQKDFYNKCLNKIENNNSKYYISELVTNVLKAPINFSKMDSILNYEFKHRNSGQLYKLISQIDIFEVIKESFKSDKLEAIHQSNNNEEHYQIVCTSLEKSKWYRASSNLILNFSNRYNYTESIDSEKIIHDIVLYLSNNTIYTIGFYAIFGIILNNKKYQSLKEGNFDNVTIPY